MAIEEIEIEGHLGQDPKHGNEKYPDMLSFSVAVKQSVKSKTTNTWESKITWYDVVSFDKAHSTYLTPRLFKGNKVVVKGKPSVKTWKTKDGQTTAIISIILKTIVLMNKPEDHKVYKVDTTDSDRIPVKYYDDDIPF